MKQAKTTWKKDTSKYIPQCHIKMSAELRVNHGFFKANPFLSHPHRIRVFICVDDGQVVNKHLSKSNVSQKEKQYSSLYSIIETNWPLVFLDLAFLPLQVGDDADDDPHGVEEEGDHDVEQGVEVILVQHAIVQCVIQAAADTAPHAYVITGRYHVLRGRHASREATPRAKRLHRSREVTLFDRAEISRLALGSSRRGGFERHLSSLKNKRYKIQFLSNFIHTWKERITILKASTLSHNYKVKPVIIPPRHLFLPYWENCYAPLYWFLCCHQSDKLRSAVTLGQKC